MFARVRELHFKPDKRTELVRMWRHEIVPMMEQCDSFFDEIALDLDTHPRKFFCHIALARRARCREVSEGVLPQNL